MDFLYSPRSQAMMAYEGMQKHDMEMEKGSLDNLYKQHQIHGQSLDNELKGSNNRVAMAGEADKIKEAGIKAASSMSEQQRKMVEQMGGQFSQIGALLESVPPEQQAAVFTQMAPQMGLDINNPVVASMIKNAGPSGNFSGTLKSVGKNMSLMTQSHLQASALNDADNVSAENQKRIQGDWQVNKQVLANQGKTDVAQINQAGANGRNERDNATKAAIATEKNKLYLSKFNDEQRWNILNQIPAEMRDDHEQAEYERLTRMRLSKGNARTPDTTPQIVNGGTPTTTQQRTDADVNAITQQGRNPAPAQAAGPIPPERFQKEGLPYEPEKFHYRINPQTGKIERKPK